MAITIKNNLHLSTGQEVHWVVSIRWRPQSDVYLATEWLDLSDSAINFERLYDGFEPVNVTAEPLLRNLSNLQQNFEVGSEGSASFEVDRNRALDSDPSRTIESFFNDTYPAEYADVFVSLVIGEPSDRTTELIWAGALEAYRVSEELVAFTAVDQTRKLMTPLTSRINKDDFPSADAGSVGQYPPFAVGEISEFPGVLVAEQFYTSLAEEVDGLQVTMEFSSTENFPDAGKVIIDDEVVSYTSKTETTISGITRGENDWDDTTTHPAAHPAGALCFLATEETVAGRTVFGPVFMLSGKALPGGIIREIHAHQASGTHTVASSDAVWDFDDSRGVLLGMGRTYPRILEQGDSGAWYAVEFDSEGAGNQNAGWNKAAGGAAGFVENEFSMVYNGAELAIGRGGYVEAFGPDFKKVYLLIEYANISHPSGTDPDFRSIPDSNFQVYFKASGSSSYVSVGTISSEQEPLADEVFDPSRVVQARPIGSNHRHPVSAGAGGGGASSPPPSMTLSSKDFISKNGTSAYSIPTDWVFPAQGLGILSGPACVASLSDTSSVAGGVGGIINTWTRLEYEWGWADESWLPYAFATLKRVEVQTDAAKSWAYTGTGTHTWLEVETYNGTSVGVASTFVSQNNMGTNEAFSDTISKSYSTEVGKILPLKGEARGWDNGVTSVSGGYCRAMGAASVSDVTIQMSPVNERSVIVLSNGGTRTWDVSTSPFSASTSNQATVARIMAIGGSGGTLTSPSFGHIGTFVNQILTPAAGTKVFHLNGASPSSPCSRLVVELSSGDFGIDDTEPARMTSLASLDITGSVNGWGALTGGAVKVVSSSSTGAYNQDVLNNDSAWVARVSYLIQAASPSRSTANNLSASFQALYGVNAAGVSSRKAGDIAYKVLTDASLLNIGGTDYFTDGWAKSSTFYSDADGPSFLANGATFDTNDPARFLSDLASQARHSLYWERGRLKMKEILTSGWPSAVKTLTEAEIMNPVQSSRRPADSIVNKVLIEYDQDYVRRGFKETYEKTDSTSEGKFGERRDEAMAMGTNDKYSGDGTTADTQAQELGDSMAERFAEPSTVVTFSTTLAGADLELGDIVGITTTGFTASKVEITKMSFKSGKNRLDEITFEGIVRT